jgi:hypothetical protein
MIKTGIKWSLVSLEYSFNFLKCIISFLNQPNKGGKINNLILSNSIYRYENVNDEHEF